MTTNVDSTNHYIRHTSTIAIGNNTVLRQELDALKYTNVYLFSKFVRENDIEDIEREIERAKKQFK